MSNFASYQTAPAPEGHPTSNAAPEGSQNVVVNNRPGSISVSADGTVTTQRPQTLNVADFVNPAGGAFATARTKTGSPRLDGAFQPSDIINIGGQEMQVSTAEMLGMVSRDGQGRYTEVQAGIDAAKAAPEVEEAVDDAKPFADPQAEASFSSLVQGVSPGQQVTVMQELINSGEVSPNSLARASSEAQREPSEMSAHLSQVMQSFRSEAVAVVTSLGSDDPEGFFDWAKEHRPREFKRAMETHGMERSTKGYGPIHQEFVATMADHDPASVLGAKFGSGITAERIGKQIVLNIPGKGQVSYGAALRAGLITVKGA